MKHLNQDKIKNENFVFIFLIFMIFAITPSIAFSQSQISDTICDDFQLEYTIEGGEIIEICHNPDLISLSMSIDASDDGQITIQIPRSMVYSLSQGCVSQDLLAVLLNGEDFTDFEIQNTPSSRIFTIDFPQGQNTLEFIGTYMLDVRIHDYCGVIYGYDSQFLPPLKQINNGISPKGILCNDGLELILKPSDNSPACVKPETSKILLERNSFIQSLLDD